MGSNSGWAISFYIPGIDRDMSIVGSFRGYGDKWEDNVITFDGLYGMNFMIWKTFQDLQDYDFSKLSIELKLFHRGNPRRPYFHGYYRVLNTWYDEVEDKYAVFGIAEDLAILDTPLIDYLVTSLPYSENRDVEGILNEVLVNNNIIPVVWHESDEPSYIYNKYEYKRFSFQPDWTVGDFISYICSENGLEWCLSNGLLHIGKELKANSEYDATKFDLYDSGDTNKISRNPFSMKIQLPASPCGPLYFMEPNWRCLWTKHSVGTKGDDTKACFTLIGGGYFPMDLFYQTLEKEYERNFCLSLMNKFKERKFPSNMIGLISSDTGNRPSKIDKVTIDKDEEQLSLKDPEYIPIRDVGDGGWYFLEDISRSSPYLDYGAGIMFPVSINPPNQLIHNIDDRIEQAVAGNFLYGKASSLFRLPVKNPDDFKFQLPNGWCLWVAPQGRMIISGEADPFTREPSLNKPFIKIDSFEGGPYSTIIGSDEESYVGVGDTNINIITKNGEIIVLVDGSGNISLETGGDVEIEGGSKINAEAPTINLGAGASVGGARLNDEIKSTIAEDASFWGYWLTSWTSFLTSWFAALNAIIAGTPAEVIAYATAMKVAVGNMQASIPSSLTGKITSASSKVNVE